MLDLPSVGHVVIIRRRYSDRFERVIKGLYFPSAKDILTSF